MKEAGRTSILSKSWRHLWAYIPTLNFDTFKLSDELDLDIKSPEVEFPRYLYWVDQVVSSYKAPTIDEFRMQFDITYLGDSGYMIDNFFRFALEKKVKRLEVDLCFYGGACRPLRHPLNCAPFCNSLTSLELANVNITGEILERFLCSCQSLEYLSVRRSETLLGLKVTGKLRTLRIHQCGEIKHLEISAPNLVSVCYFGPNINVEFKSTPKLAEVSVGFNYADDLINSFSALSDYRSQIESFSLHPFGHLEHVKISVEGPVFTRLKKLDLTVQSAWDDDLKCLELLLKACPVVHYFKLQVIFTSEDAEEREGLRKQEAYPHYHLKLVEIIGFVGYPIDLEIAAFLIESAISLEKIIIDPRLVDLIGSPWEFKESPEKIHAREQAMHLRTNLKPGTELVIL